MKSLFKQIARNLHDMCTNIYDCEECKLFIKNNGICPYEHMFGSMPCDWVFGGKTDDNKQT